DRVQPRVDLAEQLAVGRRVVLKYLVTGAVHGGQLRPGSGGRGSKPGEVLARANRSAALQALEIRASESHHFSDRTAEITPLQPGVRFVIGRDVQHRGEVHIESKRAERFGGDLSHSRGDRRVA